MLESMTGQGASSLAADGLDVTVEVRSVNNRFLKVVLHAPPAADRLTASIEERVRQSIRRGTVTVAIRVTSETTATPGRINPDAVAAYCRQAEAIRVTEPTLPPLDWSAILSLPGVVESSPRRDEAVAPEDPDGKSPDRMAEAVLSALDQALTAHRDARRREGEAMQGHLTAWLAELSEHLAAIESVAADLSANASRRLAERLGRLLSGSGVNLGSDVLAREVAVLADRSDVSEELVRLRGHLDAFAADMGETDMPGRRLDFLTQEMLRETNTIGSKAGDATVTARVIDIKALLERVRELVQNVE